VKTLQQLRPYRPQQCQQQQRQLLQQRPPLQRQRRQRRQQNRLVARQVHMRQIRRIAANIINATTTEIGFYLNVARAPISIPTLINVTTCTTFHVRRHQVDK
jgi:hypothetical protein